MNELTEAQRQALEAAQAKVGGQNRPKGKGKPKTVIQNTGIQPATNALDAAANDLVDGLRSSIRTALGQRKEIIESYVDSIAPLVNGDFNNQLLEAELTKAGIILEGGGQATADPFRLNFAAIIETERTEIKALASGD